MVTLAAWTETTILVNGVSTRKSPLRNEISLSSSMSLLTVIPQGPFESNGRKQVSLSSCGWVLIRSGQFKITQHLVAAISDTDECSFLPLGIQFRLSCTSRSNRHEIHSFSKFNQLSAIRFANMQLISCNLIP